MKNIRRKMLILIVSCLVNGPQFSFAHGGQGSGGGNGHKTGQDLVPLDIFFANHINTKFDLKLEYPKAYNHFLFLIDRIGLAIPNLANDLLMQFQEIRWSTTKLKIDVSQCINKTGIFKINDEDGEQVTILCQSLSGQVIMNSNEILKLKTPEYLGVFFLHEAFVRKMLKKFDIVDYVKAEKILISETIPYIVNYSDLNPYILLNYVKNNGYSDEIVQDQISISQAEPSVAATIFDAERETTFHSQIKAVQSVLEKQRARYFEINSILQICALDDSRINTLRAIGNIAAEFLRLDSSIWTNESYLRFLFKNLESVNSLGSLNYSASIDYYKFQFQDKISKEDLNPFTGNHSCIVKLRAAKKI